METFDSLLESARQASMESFGEPSEFDGDNILAQLLEGASDAIAGILPVPGQMDVEWVTTMIAARPALLTMPGGGETVTVVLATALADLLLDELESDLTEHARELGFNIPKGRAP